MTQKKYDELYSSAEWSSFYKKGLMIAQKHSDLSFDKQIVAIFMDWSVVFASVWFALEFNVWYSYLLSAVVIAGAQHGLLIIMHEGAHKRIHSNKYINDFVSDVFAALPIFSDTKGYRKHHNQHHQYLNTERDPDWARKYKLKDWQFPMDLKRLSFSYLKYFLFYGALEWVHLMFLWSGLAPLKNLTQRNGIKKIFTRGLFYLLAASIVTTLGVWKEFILLWMVPYLFIFPVIQRIRSVSEHFGLGRSCSLNSSRNIEAAKLECFFFAPHNVNYHLAHHLYPGVPQFNLPNFHRELMRESVYARFAHNNKSYIFPYKGSVLEDLCSPEMIERSVPSDQNAA